MLHIPEIELNFSNMCTANCLICSNCHGNRKSRPEMRMMRQSTFDKVIDELRTISFDQIQTSGNGDCFLNPNFMSNIRRLKEFGKPMWNFSNFTAYNPKYIDKIIGEKLFEKQHTRIDSMNLMTFSNLSKMDAARAWKHIEYFVQKNDCIKFSIGMVDYKKYWNKCIELFGVKPFKLSAFPEDFIMELPFNFDNIRDYFRSIAKSPNLLEFTKIKPSFWAERENPNIPNEPPLGNCPKMGIFNRICWICPNGDLNLCGYDDTQEKLVYGNVFDGIEKCWNGKNRVDLISKILNGFDEYPCNNWKACQMWEV